MLPYDPCFVHFKKHCMSCTSTAFSNRYIHARQRHYFSCLRLVSFSHHQSVTEINGTTFDALRAVAFFTPFEFVSSLPSSCPCRHKDPFARKPTDKYTTGHLKLHDLNWNSLLLRCAVDLKHYLQYMHLQPPMEANLLLCYYANTSNLSGINLQGFIH